MTDDIHLIENDGVLEIHLDRAEKKNAVTTAMYRAMTEGLKQASGSATIHAVLFAASGDSFCAGNDLKDFLAGPEGAAAAFAFIQAIATFEKPIVAAVRGDAIGVGATMLLHCDLVYAAPDARFTFPFVNLGLIPEAGSSLLVPALFGHAKAGALLLLGEPLTADHAERAGMVTEIVAADRLLDHARGKLRALAAKPPQALAAIRRLAKGDPAILAARIELEARLFANALQSPESREALRAFFEKRAPDFSAPASR